MPHTHIQTLLQLRKKTLLTGKDARMWMSCSKKIAHTHVTRTLMLRVQIRVRAWHHVSGTPRAVRLRKPFTHLLYMKLVRRSVKRIWKQNSEDASNGARTRREDDVSVYVGCAERSWESTPYGDGDGVCVCWMVVIARAHAQRLMYQSWAGAMLHTHHRKHIYPRTAVICSRAKASAYYLIRNGMNTLKCKSNVNLKNGIYNII